MKKEEKEEFCASCMTAPVLAVSAGSLYASSSMDKEKYDKQRKIAFWVGVIALIITIIISIRALSDDCSKCSSASSSS